MMQVYADTTGNLLQEARTLEEADYLYFLRRLFAGVAVSDESESILSREQMSFT